MYEPVYSAEHSALFFRSDAISSEDAFSGESNVFVCGALQEPRKMSALLGIEPPFAPAAARGYKRTVARIEGKGVPFMVPDQGDPRSVLTGIVWLHLTEASLERIESLELAGGLRKRIAIRVRIGELELGARTYVKK
jgi:hypothetical protein